jgi:putative PEP-CTERM system TPR-repeat lipoprotein
LKAIQGLEEKQPNNPLTYNLKGAALLGKKDVASARKSFERALELDATYFPATMNLAQLDASEKKFDAAKQRFEAILSKDKKHLQAMLALASLAATKGDKAETVSWLEKAKAENPKAQQPFLALSRYYLQNSELKKALEVAQQGEAINPEGPEMLDALGLAQLANNDRDGALSTFGKLTRLEENSPLAHFRLAAAQAALENRAAATLSLKRAVEIKPDFQDALVLLAGIYTREARYAEALKVAADVQQRFPKSAAGFLLEGDALLAQNKAAQAVKAVEQAYTISRTGPVLVKLHAAMIAADDKGAAQTLADGWLKQHPDDHTVGLYVAEQNLRTQDYKAAAAQYEKILAKTPSNPMALNNYAWALGQLKDARAIEYAEKAYGLASDNPSIVDTLAVLLLDAGKTQRALDLLQSATNLAPDSPDIRYHFAQALVKSGQKAKARQELERALESGRKFADEEAAKQLLKDLRNN